MATIELPTDVQLGWLLERFATEPGRAAFTHERRQVSYGELLAGIDAWSARLTAAGVRPGETVAVLGDYSPDAFCLLMALARGRNIAVPLSRESVIGMSAALGVSGCDWLAEFDDDGTGAVLAERRVASDSALLEEFRRTGAAGVVFFSSGSTGKPKGILHDVGRLAGKFRTPRQAVTAIPFLSLDHFGGINTILAITSSLGHVVTVRTRSLESVCAAIQAHRVELLPTTPSFLTMLMASNLHRQYDLGSLKRITYGTEVMPQATLDRLRAAFPGVELQQTYGLSEVGVLRSQSRPDGSLWVRIGGEGFETKVVDGILWIRSAYAMVGYLNAPSELDDEGWFNTQDSVEVDGEYVRILGRVTDVINVGGQKVYPGEVEDVILKIENVSDAVVYGESHPLLGQIVAARVVVQVPEDAAGLKLRIRKACLAALASYKAPSKVVVGEGPLASARQKKARPR
ncbi:MAG: AMP-binding protein [Acidobacteria bacterium]|nr:AMP-binding protein [Acidobacteriota bacterium]